MAGPIEIAYVEIRPQVPANFAGQVLRQLAGPLKTASAAASKAFDPLSKAAAQSLGDISEIAKKESTAVAKAFDGVAARVNADLDDIGKGDPFAGLTREAREAFETLPRNARGTVNETSAEFRRLSPAIRAELLTAEANAAGALDGISRAADTEATQVEHAFDGVGNKIAQDIEQGTSRGSSAFKRMAGVAAGVVGGLGIAELGQKLLGFGANSVKAEASFSRAMSQIQAATGSTAAELGQLEQRAVDLGAKTSFSAGEAADAMLELAKAGVGVKTQLDGAVDGTLLLAEAAGTDLATAATIASNALNTFNIRGRDMDKVASALAGAANASSASVESLAEGLSQVGPGAKNAGLNLNDTVAVLAAFDNAGIKGSDAGTALKTALTRLVPQTKKAALAMEELGLFSDKTGSAFVNADGSFKDIDEIAGILQNSLKGLSEAQKSQALATIFGSDATRAASVLADEGAAGIAKYIKATQDQDAAQAAATARMSGTAGALERLGGSFETLQLKVGQVLAPLVQFGANTLGNIVIPGIILFGESIGKAVSAIGFLLSPILKLVSGSKVLSTVFKGAAIAVGALVAANLAARAAALGSAAAHTLLAGSAGTLGKVYQALRLQTTLSTLATVRDNIAKTVAAVQARAVAAATLVWAAAQRVLNLAFLLSPIGLFVAGIAALVAAVVIAYKQSSQFRDLVAQLGEFLADLGEKALDLAQAVGGFLVDAFNDIKPALAGIGEVVKGAVAGGFADLIGAVKKVLPVLKTVAGFVGKVLLTAFRLYAAYITKVVLPIIRALVAFFVSKVLPVLTLVGRFVGTVLVGYFRLLVGIVQNVVLPIFRALASFFTTILLPAIQFVANIITTVLVFAFNLVAGIITNVLVPAFTFLASIFTNVVVPAIRIIATIVGVLLLNAFLQMVNTLKIVVNIIKAILVPVLNLLAKIFNAVVRPAIAALVGFVVNKLVPAFRAIWGFIKDRVIPIFNSFVNALKNVGGRIADFVGRAVDKFRDFRDKVKTFIDGIKGFFDGLISKARSLGTSLATNLRSGLTGPINAVIDKINGLIGAFNKLPGPDISKVPRLAKGAIVDKPTMAIFGEAGREVVVPLTRPARAVQLARESGLFKVPGMGQAFMQAQPSSVVRAARLDHPVYRTRPTVMTAPAVRDRVVKQSTVNVNNTFTLPPVGDPAQHASMVAARIAKWSER